MSFAEHYRALGAAIARWRDSPECRALPELERLACAVAAHHEGDAAVDSHYATSCLWAAQRLRQFAEAAERTGS